MMITLNGKKKKTNQQQSSETETGLQELNLRANSKSWDKSREAKRVGKECRHSRISFRQNTAQGKRHWKGQSARDGCFCHQHTYLPSGSPPCHRAGAQNLHSARLATVGSTNESTHRRLRRRERGGKSSLSLFIGTDENYIYLR